MRGAWSRPPAPRASRPRRPRAGGRDRGELPGRAQHLRKLAEKFENEKSNRLSASALPMTLQPRHILDKRCLFYQQSDDGEDGDGGVYGWSKLGGHVPSPLYLSTHWQQRGDRAPDVLPGASAPSAVGAGQSRPAEAPVSAVVNTGDYHGYLRLEALTGKGRAGEGCPLPARSHVTASASLGGVLSNIRAGTREDILPLFS
ncbi:hypothetical protein ABFV05_009089 [Capra hircus]